jgi:hypothetical protein
MSEIISRMFNSFERATEAANAVRNFRFLRFPDTFVVGPHGPSASGSEPLSTDAIEALLLKAYVLKSNAKVFAERIRRGGTLVTVHAPFGTAVDATNILDEYGPIDSGVANSTDRLPRWDDAAPLSSMLHMSTHAPFSSAFPLLLKSGATTSSALGLGEISRSAAPLSASLGLPLLSSNPAPLSSMLGLPLIRKSGKR